MVMCLLLMTDGATVPPNEPFITIINTEDIESHASVAKSNVPSI
jgi:hypothetical protein